jgi:hypothetical protein
MDYKITKVVKYGKGLYQSEKIGSQWYNVVYARLYPNDGDKSSFYKVHFIHMFDGEDLWEYFNGCVEDGEQKKECFSKADVKECRDELIYGAAESLFYGNDINSIVKECNDTIQRYA